MKNGTKHKITPGKRIGAIAYLYTVFAVGAVLGRLCWEHIRLPFHNPWDIHSLLTMINYNPNNTLLRLIMIAVLPSFLLWAFFVLRIHQKVYLSDTPDQGERILRSQRTERMNWILPALLMLGAVIASLYVHTDIATGSLDTFHEGESIGLAALYERGDVPYKDFIIGHGPFQDPLRSVIAFKLFGRSIAATRTFASMIKLLEFAFLGLLLTFIFRHENVWSFSAMGVFLLLLFIPLYDDWGDPIGNVASLIQRDVMTLAFLVAILWLYRIVQTPERSAWKVMTAAFLCVITGPGALIYSVDRGIYLTAAYAILSAVLYIAYIHRSPFRWYYLLASFAGVICAVVLLGAAVRWNLSGFIQFSFFVMPKHWDLQCGLVYSIEKLPFLCAILLVAANTYWITLQFLRIWRVSRQGGFGVIKAFMDCYFIEFSLFVCSVLFLKTWAARSDWPHVSIGLLPSYLLSLVIIFKHYAPLVVRGRLKTVYSGVIACLVLYWSAVGIKGMASKSVWINNFPLRIHDQALVPVNYQNGARFLRKNLQGNETFYSLTNEGIWYYLVDRPCPTRYPIAYFACPDFIQHEVIRDLQRNNVKLILVGNSRWCYRMDGLWPHQRLPILTAYVKENYKPFCTVDDMVFWIRRH